MQLYLLFGDASRRVLPRRVPLPDALLLIPVLRPLQFPPDASRDDLPVLQRECPFIRAHVDFDDEIMHKLTQSKQVEPGS